MAMLPKSGGRVDGVENKRCGIDVWQQRELVERGPERAGIRRVDHDDELAFGVAAADLASFQGQDGGFHAREALRARLHQDAGDFTAGRSYHGVRIEQTARNESPTIDCALRSGHDVSPE